MLKEDIFSLIVKHTIEVIPELEDHAFVPSDRLSDLGANSIDRSEIITLTLEAVSLKIPRVDLATAKNIGGLAEVIYGKL
ncbi:acyl carrier protein [Paenibacillus alba]|uniref:acyl carrier protein n=1 Tax=Paenibacillus alba TaxID=1197127 RepID=UPI00156734E1|nr:acyl carrier protein [Paenibacillus alba]NQX71867.1 acyl carrier protein [Paenibacillus alba]